MCECLGSEEGELIGTCTGVCLLAVDGWSKHYSRRCSIENKMSFAFCQCIMLHYLGEEFESPTLLTECLRGVPNKRYPSAHAEKSRLALGEKPFWLWHPRSCV